MYAKDGKLKYCYNLFGIKFYPESRPPPCLQASIRCGWSSRTRAAVWPKVAPSRSLWMAERWAGQLPATQPMIFSADETCDVGKDTGSTVSPDYTAETSKFNGTINWIQLDQGADDKII